MYDYIDDDDDLVDAAGVSEVASWKRTEIEAEVCFEMDWFVEDWLAEPCEAGEMDSLARLLCERPKRMRCCCWRGAHEGLGADSGPYFRGSMAAIS